MLFIVDMQNDFIDQENGMMTVKNADKLIPGILKKIEEYVKKDDLIFYSINVHKNMPSNNRPLDKKEWGEDLYGELKNLLKSHISIRKYNYGIPPVYSESLFKEFDIKHMKDIEILGVETHVCVLSTAIILQNIFFNSRILVDENLCISNDIILHKKALDIMESLKMEVKRK